MALNLDDVFGDDESLWADLEYGREREEAVVAKPKEPEPVESERPSLSDIFAESQEPEPESEPLAYGVTDSDNADWNALGEPKKEEGFLAKIADVGTSLEKGWYGAGVSALGFWTSTALAVDESDTPEEMEEKLAAAEENRVKIEAWRDHIQSLPQNEQVDRLTAVMKEKGLGAFFTAIIDDLPAAAEAAINATAESAPYLAGGVAVGAGTLLTGGGATAAMLMGMAGSAAMNVVGEGGGEMLDFLGKNGVDFTDKEALRAALQNEELMSKAQAQGYTYGGITAAVETALALPTLGLSKFGTIKPLAKAVTAQLLDTAGGGLGAYAAETMTPGHEADMSSVAGELLGGGGSATIATGIDIYSGMKDSRSLRYGDPEAINEKINTMADKNGMLDITQLPSDVRKKVEDAYPDVIRPRDMMGRRMLEASMVKDALGVSPQDLTVPDVEEEVPTEPTIEEVTAKVTEAQTADEVLAALKEAEKLIIPKAAPAKEAATTTPLPDVLGTTPAAEGTTETLDLALPNQWVWDRGDQPFATRELAMAYASAREDGQRFDPVEVWGGWVLEAKDEMDLQLPTEEAAIEPANLATPEARVAAAADDEYLSLTHWSNTTGLSEIDSAKYGTAGAGVEKRRLGSKPETPYSFFGLPGYKAESMIGQKGRYFTQVKKSEMYDSKADPDNLRAKAKAKLEAREDQRFAEKGYRFEVTLSPNDYEREIAAAGYKGFYVDNVAAMFGKTPVKEITQLAAEVPGVAGYDELGSQTPPSKGSKTTVPAAETAAKTASQPVAGTSLPAGTRNASTGPKTSSPAKATIEDFKPGKVTQITGRSDWAILEAGNPKGKKGTPEENAAKLKILKDRLRASGKKFTDTVGKYGEIGNGVLVTGITEEEAHQLGNDFDQDSVLVPRGLLYSDGSLHPATGKTTEIQPGPNDDFYTTIPETGASFQNEIDFENKIPAPSDTAPLPDDGVARGDDFMADVVPDGETPFGTKHEFLKKVAAGLTKSFAITRSGKVRIITVAKQSDLPQSIKDKLGKKRVRGIFAGNNVVYLVGENLSGTRQIVRTFLHEVGLHAGLRHMLGTRIDALLDNMIESKPNEIETHRVANKLPDTLEGRRQAAEEYLADMSESNPSLGFVKELYARLRNAIRRAVPGLKMTDNDLAYIVQSSIKAARDGYSRSAIAIRKVYPPGKPSNHDAMLSAEPAGYTLRKGGKPKKTIKAYKAFRLIDGELYPMFVDATSPLPQGAWLDAKDGGYHFTGENGREYVPSSTGKGGSTVKFTDPKIREELIALGYLPKNSKATGVVAMAYRPGWHAGVTPFFPQSGNKVTVRGEKRVAVPDDYPYENVHLNDTVIAEIEIDADQDFQQEYQDTAERSKDGKINPKLSGIRRIPKGGYYRYATNPMFQDKPEAGDWMISGSIKINRIMSREEVNSTLDERGIPRQLWADEVDIRTAILDDVNDETKFKSQPKDTTRTLGAFGDSTISSTITTPTSKYHHMTNPVVTTTRQLLMDEKISDKNAAVIQDLHLFRKGELDGLTKEQVYEAYVRRTADNLKFLLRKFDEQFPHLRDRAKHWYDGANKIAGVFADRYGVSKEQASAVLALMSPKMDWFKNISIAERTLDFLRNVAPTVVWTDEMEAVAAQVMRGNKDIWKSIRGKAYSELTNPLEKASFLRCYDEAHNSIEYAIIDPEGDVIGIAKATDKVSRKGVVTPGEPMWVTWQDFPTIANAISAFEDGSIENISTIMGMEQKIRAFYNNIIQPNSENHFVTIDTHSVSAAYMMPLSGTHGYVNQAWGGGFADAKLPNIENYEGREERFKTAYGLARKAKELYDFYVTNDDTARSGSSGKVGAKGLYGPLTDAHKLAAMEDGGLLPREIQSITWEAIRLLFPREIKGKLATQSSEVWKSYHNGDGLTYEQAREKIWQLGGGKFKEPSWTGSTPLLPADQIVSFGPGLPGYVGVRRAGGGPYSGRPDSGTTWQTAVAQATAGQSGSDTGSDIRSGVADIQYSLAGDYADLAMVDTEAVEAINRKVENVRSWFGDDKPVQVVGRASELPFEAPADTRGVAWRGQVWLVAERFSSKADAHDVYAHEMVGHLKAEQTPGYQDVLQNVQQESGRVGIVKTIWDQVASNRGVVTTDTLAREVVAQLAERQSKHPLIRRMVNAYKKLLKALGAINPVEADIYDLITRAYRQENITADNVPYFSVVGDALDHLMGDPASGKLYRTQTIFQDDTRPLQEAEKALGGDGGVRSTVLRQRSYKVHEINNSIENFVKPLLAAVKESGFSEEQVSKFLHARHAMEANESLRRRNIERMTAEGALPQGLNVPLDQVANYIQGPQRAYWQALWDAPAGMTDADARAIQGQFLGSPAMQRVGALADAIGSERLRLLESSGIVSPLKAQILRQAYKHYVPLLRNVDQPNEMTAIKGMTSKKNRKGLYIRKGSTKVVSDVMSNLINEYQKLVLQASNNTVWSEFYKMVAMNPGNGLFEINETEELVSLDAAGNIKVKDQLISNPAFVTSGYINGKRVNIVANKTSAVAQDVVKVFNGVSGVQGIEWITKMSHTIMRPLAMLYTTLNLDFIFSNPARDLQSVMFNVSGDEVGGRVKGRAKILAKWTPMLGSLLLDQFGIHTGSARQAVWQEMQEYGGNVDWLSVYPDKPEKTLAKIKRMTGVSMTGFDRAKLVASAPVRGLVKLSNAFENATRAVVYQVVRDANVAKGMTPHAAKADAALKSREVTADFLRHGTASGAIGGAYMFFNPAVQSSFKAGQKLADAPFERIAFMAGLVGMYVMLDMMNRADSDDDDEDGVKNYDEPSIEYSKERNIPFDAGNGKYYTMPQPYIYNVLWVMGQEISKRLTDPTLPPVRKEGNDVIGSDVLGSAIRIASSMFRSVNPIGGETLMQSIMPTLLDPFDQIRANESWFGGPLYPDKKWGTGPGNKQMTYQQANKSTPEVYKEFGEWIHFATGGDEYNYGILGDKGLGMLENPEALQLLFQTYAGGPGTMIERLFNYMDKGRTDDIPIVRRFIKEPDQERDLNTKWWATVNTMDELVRRAKDAETPEAKSELRSKNPAANELFLSRYKEAKNSYDKLNKARKKTEEGTSEYDRLTKEMEVVQLALVRGYNAANKGK